MFTLPLFIPSPTSVGRSIWTMIQNGSLSIATWYSFKRIAMSTCIAGTLSLLVALTMQVSDSAKSIVYPVIRLMRYLPATAFYPLLMMWTGIGEVMKVSFLTFVSFVYMMPSAVLTFEDTPRDMHEAGKALGLNKAQILTRIVFPYCMPSILKSFSLCMGIGLTYLTVAEETNAIYGLGFMVNNASSRGRTEVVFAAIIVLILFGVLIDHFSDKLIQKIFKWK